jgi:hypothetical protein
MPIGGLLNQNLAGRSSIFGVVNPGSDLEISGTNSFINASRNSRDANDALLGTANQEGLSGALSDSLQTANESFDTAEGTLDRRQRGLGISLSARQKKSQNRQLGLTRAIAQANATNSVRTGFQERATDASKQALGIEQDLRDLDSSGRIALSSAAGQEQVRIEQERARKKASRGGILGSIAGIGLNFASGGLSGALTGALG